IDRAGSSRRLSGNGRDSNPAADFINGAATAAAFNSSLMAQGSATSSKHFSVAAAGALLSADLADVRRQRSVAQMSKPTSWSRLKKRCTDRLEQSLCAELARTRWKITRSRSRGGIMKGSESVCAGRGKPESGEEKAAMCAFACVWRGTGVSQSKPA